MRYRRAAAPARPRKTYRKDENPPGTGRYQVVLAVVRSEGAGHGPFGRKIFYPGLAIRSLSIYR
jgi:hypothetical protein